LELHAGWLESEREASFDASRLENIVEFDGGWAELRRFKWSKAQETTWRTARRCYFLSFVLDGPPVAERRNMALTQTSPYGGGKVRLTPPDQTIYSASSTDGELRLLRCFIDAEFVESICVKPPSEAELTQLGAIDFGGSAIEWLLQKMHREISRPEIGMTIAIESIAREIAVEIVRTLERRRPKSRHSGGLPAWQMRLLLERVHAEGPLPKVAELADICGLTARHLGRAFHAETGKTLSKLIASVMAERAGTMLTAGMPVGTVAATLGYGSSSNFADAFRRETGLLPSSVRKGRGFRRSVATGDPCHIA
jgi:AraC-like DNA-binding protein